jgi:hypothetical protein
MRGVYHEREYHSDQEPNSPNPNDNWSMDDLPDNSSPLFRENINPRSVASRINVAATMLNGGALERNLFINYFIFIFACVKLTLSGFFIGFRPIGCKLSPSYRCLMLMMVNDAVQIVCFGWDVIPVGWRIWSLEGEKNFLYQKEKPLEIKRILKVGKGKMKKLISFVKILNIM